jgi:hypothetical protein
MSKVAHLASSIPPITAQFVTIASNLSRVCHDLAAVGAQLLLRSAIPSVLTIFAQVLSTLAGVATYLAPVSAQFLCVGPDLTPVSSQLPALRWLKPTTTVLRNCAANQTRCTNRNYKHASQK